jgi:hypothetical protein
MGQPPEPVNVGTFLAIHFDVDEVFIHKLSSVFIFKRFVRHDMTPMTGGVSDAEEDRLVFGFSFCERFFAPWIPVHWFVGVLKQVWGCFMA